MRRSPVAVVLVPLVAASPLAAAHDHPLEGRWQFEMEREGWQPRHCNATLELERDEGGWAGTITFDVILYAQPLALTDIAVTPRGFTFGLDAGEFDIRVRGTREGDTLSGDFAWDTDWDGAFSWTAARIGTPERFEEGMDLGHGLERAAPGAAGIDERALDDLILRAERTQSDALIVLKDGKVVCERYFGHDPGPIEAMSATKSIVGLAVCLLIDDGKIESLDTPVHTFYPEWRQGLKERITIRHLLTHTSGLQSNRTTEQIYASPDFVQLALAADLSEDPGAVFRYNNKAVNLLAGVVERASGMRLDEYLGERLFAPLGIDDFGWTLDSSGNPHAMSGLQIRPIDLAKIGHVMLRGGAWQGRPVLSGKMVSASITPCEAGGATSMPAYGLLWWLEADVIDMYIDWDLIDRWRAAGADEGFLERISVLEDRRLAQREFLKEVMIALTDEGEEPDFEQIDPPQLLMFGANTRELGQPQKRVTLGPVRSYAAKGYLGQYLVVIPEHGLVAVRMRRYPQDEAELQNWSASFGGFASAVEAIVAK